MNEQLQGALAQIIEKTLGGIDAATGFLTNEMPDVIYQLLLWYGVRSLIMTVLALLAVSLFLWGERKVYLMQKEADDLEITMAYMLGGCVIRVPFFIAVWVNVSLEWLQIWIAPKIWLLEYAANLVK